MLWTRSGQGWAGQFPVPGGGQRGDEDTHPQQDRYLAAPPQTRGGGQHREETVESQ